ncbi:hypothetical protein D3C83_236610 [compost metagenome]
MAAQGAGDEADIVIAETDIEGRGSAPAVLTGDDDATEPTGSSDATRGETGGGESQERPGPSAS